MFKHNAMEAPRAQTSAAEGAPFDLDSIIREMRFGWGQARTFFILCMVVFAHRITEYDFVFTTRDTQYRCYVKGCDAPADPVYDTPWLKYAIPFEGGVFSKCRMRQRPNNDTDPTSCEPDSFDANATLVSCRDGWVYGDGTTIVRDFGIPCQPWKRALIGTLGNVGRLVGLAANALVADRLGRKTIAFWATFFSGVVGMASSFAPNFITYASFEFLSKMFTAGVFSTVCVLAAETVAPERRVLVMCCLRIASMLGMNTLAGIAWLVPDWRHVVLIMYAPAVIVPIFYGTVPESVRWLLASGKYAQGVDILKRTADANGVTLSSTSTEHLNKLAWTRRFEDEPRKVCGSLLSVLASKKVAVRLLVCMACMVALEFVTFGLALEAVFATSAFADIYINYVIVHSMVLPSTILEYALLDRFGRKRCIFASLVACCAFSVGFVFTPTALTAVRLAVYACGKLSVDLAFSMFWMHTIEMLPTEARHSMLSAVMTVGRIGGVLAPMMPLLGSVYKGLPMLVFAATAFLTALVMLTFPETTRKRLPDTIRESERISSE